MNRTNTQQSPLPPGDLDQLLELEQADRSYLLRATEAYGPIFKALSGSHLCVCVVGLGLGRQFLQEHGEALRPVTLELESLFPLGFMRQMRGAVHQKYRGIVVKAVRSCDSLWDPDFYSTLVASHLQDYMQTQDTHRRPSRAYVVTLTDLVTSMLIHVFFGARPGSPLHGELIQGFKALGPFGLSWTIGPKQTAAFARLRSALLEHHWNLDDGLTGRIVEADGLDETMLGNLIYMVEMGRFDMAGYFRWLTWHGAHNPDRLEAISRDPTETVESGRSMAQAFALETLRMDQSERLLRKVEQDIVFHGFRIPETSTVRICLWEAHKSSQAFPEPLAFNPDRFLSDAPSGESFSPFGLDRHRCPLSDVAIKLAYAFITTLAMQYRLELAADGPAVRGPYHWEPATRFAVRLLPRD